jgi:hypothetical protein
VRDRERETESVCVKQVLGVAQIDGLETSFDSIKALEGIADERKVDGRKTTCGTMVLITSKCTIVSLVVIIGFLLLFILLKVRGIGGRDQVRYNWRRGLSDLIPVNTGKEWMGFDVLDAIGSKPRMLAIQQPSGK